MESRDYEAILNAMPEMGIYVVRETNHEVLYFNERVRETSPGTRLGAPCHEVWGGSCACCPLLTIQNRARNRAVGYSEAYGGVVDIAATRTLWEGDIPAFVLTVTPRMGSAGYTYRKILRLDLKRDLCTVLKSEPDSWQPAQEHLSAQMEQFAMGGAIHPEDVERFVAFTRLERLRAAVRPGEKTASLLYRRQGDGGFRWNLMEVMPGQSGFAILCVKEVHDVLREGLEREGMEDRGYIISSLSSLFFSTYYVDLEQDTFRAVTQLHRVGDVLGNEVSCSAALYIYASHFIHPDDREEFLRVMNVKNLRGSLRWWQPCVAVEYRMLPDDPEAGADACRLVRATVVLARTGAGDVPATAVYVAQDITGSRIGWEKH